MISNYSTFIQIIAALYLTMSIDSLIYKRFWSLDYKRLVLSKLRIFKHDTSNQLECRLSNFIDRKQQQSEHDARIWGLHFCLFCFILLIFCGYEQDYIKEVIKEKMYMGIPLLIYFFTMLLTTVFLFFMKNRYIYVIVSCVIYSLLTIISIIICKEYNLQCLCDNSIYYFASKNIELFIILIIVLPILIQLARLWIASKGYSYIIGQKFKEELLDYRQALNALKNNKPEDMPKSYHEASTAALCAKGNSVGDEDVKINNEFFTFLIKHLIEKMKEPSIDEQIKAAIKVAMKPDDSESSESSSEDAPIDDEIPTPESQSMDVIDKYRDLINEYSKMQGVKITTFCSERNIDETEFRYARTELMKNKK